MLIHSRKYQVKEILDRIGECTTNFWLQLICILWSIITDMHIALTSSPMYLLLLQVINCTLCNFIYTYKTLTYFSERPEKLSFWWADEMLNLLYIY